MKDCSEFPKNFKILDKDLDKETLNRYLKSRSIAVDTEAMGLIHGRDRLCLIQICDEEDFVTCIRICLGQTNAPRLKLLFEDQNIEKIFHFARFDVAALLNNLTINVYPIFCTKIASKLARTYTNKHGLKDLILELTGVALDKQAQSSDWGKANQFSNKQLLYAANDVRFLISARNELKKMLIREDRWELANQCFQCISTFSELDINHFFNIFER